MNVLRVISAGLLTTVQDRGRSRAARWGVPRGGAMDQFALIAADRLLGNGIDAAALEITAGGAAFEFLAPTLITITGADVEVWLDDQNVPLWTAVYVRSGALLSIGQRRGDWGARSYLAVASGFDVPSVLGSRGTYLAGGWGGFGGRALRTGDTLAATPTSIDLIRLAGRAWPTTDRPAYRSDPTLRFVAGPHLDRLVLDALDRIRSDAYVIAGSSNRMGYRLIGPRLDHVDQIDLPSLPVLPGVIQVPPDGAPILLMADAQPTGGYPVAGVVIDADLPLAAQLLPGDRVRFDQITLDEALAARHEMHAWLHSAIEDDPTVEMLGWIGS